MQARTLLQKLDVLLTHGQDSDGPEDQLHVSYTR